VQEHELNSTEVACQAKQDLCAKKKEKYILSNTKVKLFLCLIKHHATKTYREL